MVACGRIRRIAMNGLPATLRLLRPFNLLIIALTMALMRYFVLQPLVAINGFELQLTTWQFAVLVLSTVLIAAAGNVINDYFDQRTDRVNKPAHIIVGVHVKRRVAMLMHQIFNVLGVGMAVVLAWRVDMWSLAIVSFFAAGSLWFYSMQFKRELIVGNLMVAFLTALVPLLVGLYEIPLLMREYGAEVAAFFAEKEPDQDPLIYFKIMFYFIFIYAGFAFMLNLIREIQKDMADVKGDKKIGSRSIPIVFGMKNAKQITGALLVIAAVLIVAFQQRYVNHPYVLAYVLVAVILPMALSFYHNWKAVYRRDFVVSGNYLKVAMLGGLLYTVVHYFIYYVPQLP